MKTEPTVLLVDDSHPLIRARVEVRKLREGLAAPLLRIDPEAGRSGLVEIARRVRSASRLGLVATAAGGGR